MRAGATRDEILRTTREAIMRNGIRNVRIDEIARTLGISKRTLYELFTDKNELVCLCLEEIGRQQRERVTALLHEQESHPLQRAYDVMRMMVDGLYLVDASFLIDIRRKFDFNEHFREQAEFWQQAMLHLFEESRDRGFLLPDPIYERYAHHMCESFVDLRIGNVPREELYAFSRTTLRGLATREGVAWIDAGLHV